jgi:two-component system cell cycle response regulator DivK
MGSVNILYIEDNPGNRMLVRRILEAEGYTVSEATDGPSGLKTAAQVQPDLILLDINLPEMDGYDLARRMRGMSNLKRVPILAVTANVMQGDRERTLEAGCDGFIPKPIDVDKLPEQVKVALERGRVS